MSPDEIAKTYNRIREATKVDVGMGTLQYLSPQALATLTAAQIEAEAIGRSAAAICQTMELSR